MVPADDNPDGPPDPSSAPRPLRHRLPSNDDDDDDDDDDDEDDATDANNFSMTTFGTGEDSGR